MTFRERYTLFVLYFIRTVNAIEYKTELQTLKKKEGKYLKPKTSVTIFLFCGKHTLNCQLLPFISPWFSKQQTGIGVLYESKYEAQFRIIIFSLVLMHQFKKNVISRLNKTYSFHPVLLLFFKVKCNGPILNSIVVPRNYFGWSISADLHSEALQSSKY